LIFQFTPDFKIQKSNLFIFFQEKKQNNEKNSFLKEKTENRSTEKKFQNFDQSGKFRHSLRGCTRAAQGKGGGRLHLVRPLVPLDGAEDRGCV
jgi:hypothetical protein